METPLWQHTSVASAQQQALQYHKTTRAQRRRTTSSIAGYIDNFEINSVPMTGMYVESSETNGHQSPLTLTCKSSRLSDLGSPRAYCFGNKKQRSRLRSRPGSHQGSLFVVNAPSARTLSDDHDYVVFTLF